MEAVHIFGGIDGFEDALGVHLGRKRELDENAVDVVVTIQIFDHGEHFESPYCGQWSDESAGEAELFASSDFGFYVKLRGGIFADEDGGKAGANSRCGEDADLVAEFGEDLVADFEAVENARGHAELAFVVRREIIAQGKTLTLLT
jgi:hypothetical protein